MIIIVFVQNIMRPGKRKQHECNQIIMDEMNKEGKNAGLFCS